MSQVKVKLLSLMMIISILCNGCLTHQLWRVTDPNEYVQIKDTEINEDVLKAKEIKYIKSEETHSYYIEKDSAYKLKDYTCRVLGTPITVALDAGSIVFVVIAFLIANDEIDKAIERGKEAEATKNGYRTEPPPLYR